MQWMFTTRSLSLPTHPFRRLPNVLATPHLGYVSEGLYRTFYGDSLNNIKGWLDRTAARQ
jgi:phosphoglycerate dehydrogenase-like enzyme